VTTLLTAFALVGVFLAMLGIYGVTAYAVQQRQKEVAIRVALGASERAVLRVFLREGALLLGTGTAVGLLGAGAVSRALRHQVYGLQGFEVSTYIAGCTILMVFGLAATWWPVRHAVTAETLRALNAN
jgi:ABC-type antimicrobial peptide transport system permease subunit